MNKRFLKYLRDQIPEPLKYLTASFFRSKLINNKEFNNYYQLLNNRETIDQESVKKYQLDQLKQVLMHSYQNVPYYTELFNKLKFNPLNLRSFNEIKIIPLLTKDLIRENFDKLISTKKIKGGCYSTTTSGSTGDPLKFLLDYESFFKENAFIYYFRKKLGYDFNDRMVTFRGIDFGDKLWKFNPIHGEVIFSPFKLSGRSLESYVNEINHIKPSYLNGYFSSIYFFARLLSDSNLKLNFKLKGIFLISENVDNTERDFVESFFGAKSLTFYGHSERCVIAQEINKNEYAFDPYYGFTETIKTEQNRFKIVGTAFLNKTMPLIRYETDDYCTQLRDNVFSIYGKREVNDFLYGINDEKIFSSSLHFLSDILINVTNYQFIQDKKGVAELLLVPSNSFDKSGISIIKSEIDKKMKGIIDFDIKVAENVILSSRGKFNMFINNVKHPDL